MSLPTVLQASVVAPLKSFYLRLINLVGTFLVRQEQVLALPRPGVLLRVNVLLRAGFRLVVTMTQSHRIVYG